MNLNFLKKGSLWSDLNEEGAFEKWTSIQEDYTVVGSNEVQILKKPIQRYFPMDGSY
jgi:hypothetical protein